MSPLLWNVQIIVRSSLEIARTSVFLYPMSKYQMAIYNFFHWLCNADNAQCFELRSACSRPWIFMNMWVKIGKSVVDYDYDDGGETVQRTIFPGNTGKDAIARTPISIFCSSTESSNMNPTKEWQQQDISRNIKTENVIEEIKKFNTNYTKSLFHV